jgi:hypothetical protein
LHGDLIDRAVSGQPTSDVDHHVQTAEMFERNLHRQGRDVRLGQISGTGPGIHPLSREFSNPFGHTHGILIASHDLGASLAEGQRDRVPDLARPAHPGHEHDPVPEIEPRSSHVVLRLSSTMPAPGAPA